MKIVYHISDNEIFCNIHRLLFVDEAYLSPSSVDHIRACYQATKLSLAWPQGTGLPVTSSKLSHPPKKANN